MFGSFRDWRVHVNVPVALSQTVLDQTNITSGLVNVTYQLNAKNKITGFYSRQRYSKPNRLLNSADDHGRRLDERRRRRLQRLSGAVERDHRRSNLFIDARLGLQHDSVPDLSERRTTQSLTDNVTGIVTGNYTGQHGSASAAAAGQRDSPVLRRSGARRPPRVQVRHRSDPRRGRSRKRRASTT